MCKEKNADLAQQLSLVQRQAFESLLTDFEDGIRFYQTEEKTVEEKLRLQVYDEKYKTCKRVTDLFISTSTGEVDEAIKSGFQMLRNMMTELTSGELETGGPNLEPKQLWIQQCALEDYLMHKDRWSEEGLAGEGYDAAMKEAGLENAENQKKDFSLIILTALLNRAQKTVKKIDDTDSYILRQKRRALRPKESS